MGSQTSYGFSQHSSVELELLWVTSTKNHAQNLLFLFSFVCNLLYLNGRNDKRESFVGGPEADDYSKAFNKPLKRTRSWQQDHWLDPLPPMSIIK